MRMTALVGRTIREAPRDSELVSHKLLVRAGYIRQYSSGIYGFLPLAWRSIRKIEDLCRQEMNSINGQEIRMPTLATRELWEETGRYHSIGKELFRLKDRHDKDHVLCMTHEEPAVYLARTELVSYKQLPAMLYQFQTKFRDEPRPRGGLVRTREFIMKDAYSFHTSEQDLLKYYESAHKAYERFFHRVGFKDFASVRSDNGIFGGQFSHEFMAIASAGEDTLIVCKNCSYKANVEVATTPIKPTQTERNPLRRINTPDCSTISELVSFINRSLPAGSEPITEANTCKAVLFETIESDRKTLPTLVCAFVRGDRDVAEQKMVSLIGRNLAPAQNATIESSGAVAGSTGPIKDDQLLDLSRTIIVFDPSLRNEASLFCGANEKNVHLSGLNLDRDIFPLLEVSPHLKENRFFVSDITQVRAGDSCPECSGTLETARGIEIGNIFHLGTKYSNAMGATYLDEHGKNHDLIMGCYGIGITRVLSALIEEHHDEKGMILPLPVAPYEVHLNALNCSDSDVRQTADEVYMALTKAGIEVLYDDRDEKPGSQFADADLIGIPLRIIIAPRGLAADQVEFKYRKKERAGENIGLGEKGPDRLKPVVSRILEIRELEYAKYNVQI